MEVISYDIDGVLYPLKDYRPAPGDVIITGRSFEEAPETYSFLQRHGIFNSVFFNPLPFDMKSRKTSGIHKGLTILRLKFSGVSVNIHYEDDPIQIEEIKRLCPWITIIHVTNNPVELENVRHG